MRVWCGVFVWLSMRVPIRRADVPGRRSGRRAARAACVAGSPYACPTMFDSCCILLVFVSAKWAGLVGDVNIFTHDYDDPNNAEIEVMIADAGHRRKGLAQEAVTVMMSYGADLCRVFVLVLLLWRCGLFPGSAACQVVVAPTQPLSTLLSHHSLMVLHVHPSCQQGWRC